jgi:hypothetical protein
MLYTLLGSLLILVVIFGVVALAARLTLGE